MANEHIEEQSTSIDHKLEATDANNLAELHKAFDASFPREGEPTSEPKGPAKKPEPGSGRREPEPSKSGHHAPVQVEKEPESPQGPDKEELNLLGVPELKARPRKARAGAPVVEPEPEPEIPEPEGEPKKEEGPKEDEADPEVDAVRVKENAHPAVKDGIQRLKTIAHNRRKENRDLIRRNQALATEVTELKRSGVSPEIQAELTKLRATSQRFDLLNDAGFRAKYEDPIAQKGDQLCQYVVELSGGSEAMKDWARQTKEFGYGNIRPAYWDNEVLDKIPSETERNRVARMAAELTQLSDERNRVVNEFVSNPDKVTEYQQAKSLEWWTNYTREAKEESDLLISQIGDWAKIKDLANAKSDEQKADWEEHNKRCEGYQTLFEKTMGDIINGGARKHVRIAAMAIYGMDQSRENKELREDCRDLETENRQLKGQIAKLSRSRSIPGTRGGGIEVKAEKGLSTKSAEAALKEFWSSQGS